MKRHIALATILFAATTLAGSLVRLSVDKEQLAAITAAQVPVYKDLGTSVLLSLEPGAIESYRGQGWQLEVLDPDLSPGEYFIVFRAGIGRTALPSLPLWQDDRRALVRMSETDALAAKAAGFEMVRLPDHPHPLVSADAPLGLPLNPDTTIARLIGEISQDSLLATMRRLQNYVTRYSYNVKCESAAYYLYGRFADLGLAMRLDTYYLRSPTTRAFNVEATIVGQVRPESVVIACAHFDSYSSNQSQAPGADDNATGTAAALEIARVLRNTPLRWTVKLLCFSGEEQWMKGSYHWVDSTAVTQQMKIAGAFNLDMFGYTAFDSTLVFVNRNTASTPLAALAESVNAWYDLGLRVLNYLDEDCAGDNTPFWDHGYKSVFALEDSEYGIWNGSNPHYHTPHDTVGICNMAQVRRVTQMTLACVASLAGIHDSVGIAEASPAPARTTGLPTVFAGQLALRGHEQEQFMLYDAAGNVKGTFAGRGIASSAPSGVYFVKSAESASPLLRVTKVR